MQEDRVSVGSSVSSSVPEDFSVANSDGRDSRETEELEQLEKIRKSGT